MDRWYSNWVRPTLPLTEPSTIDYRKCNTNTWLSQRTMNEGFKFIFPKKYVIPKSLKVGHWLSELQLKFGMQYPAKKVAQAMHAMACIDWVVYQCLKYYAQFRNPQSLILLPQQFQQFLHWNTCPRCHLLPIASSSSPCPRATERSVRGAMAPTHLVFPSSNECCHT